MSHSSSNQDKIIVVGAGVYGLSTVLSLLKSGMFQEIHLFDKNDYFKQSYSYFDGCDSASSDMNKIFRCSYGTQYHYQRLALASREVFLQWNQQIKESNWEGGDPIYINSGNVHLTDQKELPSFEAETLKSMKADGKDDAICVADLDAATRAVKLGLPAASVDPFEAKAQGRHLQGVLDVTGGTIIADKCCRWVLHLCETYNDGRTKLVTHFGSKEGQVDLLLVERNQLTGGKKCVGIRTKDQKLHFASKVCVFGGSWTAQIVPEAGEKLEATGGTVALIRVEDNPKLATNARKYNELNFPTWTYKVRDGAMGGLYGFPLRNGYLKIGYRGLKWTNPQGKINSKTKTKYTEEQSETNVPIFGLNVIKNFIRENIPEVERISMTRLCWYSDSEDNDFLISYCPYYESKSLFVGAGDSGHAFMMFGSLGNVIRDILFEKSGGSTDLDFLTQLFSWKREREKLNLINQGVDDPRALCHLKMAIPKDWIINPGKL